MGDFSISWTLDTSSLVGHQHCQTYCDQIMCSIANIQRILRLHFILHSTLT